MGAFRSDPNVKQINDKITKADTDNTITYSQYQIKAQEDKSFFITHFYNGLASGSSTNLYVVNPADSGKTMYIMTTKINSTDQGLVHYKENVQGVSGGTQKTPTTVDRSSTAQSVIQVTADITYSSADEICDPEVVPGGSGKYATGGSDDGYITFILKPGKDLLIEVDNTSSNSNNISIRLNWWEE